MSGHREDIRARTALLQEAVANLEAEMGPGGATDIRYYRLREIAYAGLELVESLDGLTDESVVASLQSLVNAHVYAFMRSPPTRPIDEGFAAARQLINLAVTQLFALDAAGNRAR